MKNPRLTQESQILRLKNWLQKLEHISCTANRNRSSVWLKAT
ncbi:hypothetical protein LEMLEM_LOCUS16572 [Lemmus lemmus]